MNTATPDQRDWPLAMRRYLGASIAGHLLWETLQLPLYTLWTSGTFKQKAFAVFHCSLGDVMISGLTLLAALALFARANWPRSGMGAVFAASVSFGIIYTIYSEWLNVNVRGSWSYSDLMPVVPVIGTGLAPLIQWLIVPALAMWFAIGRPPWRDDCPDEDR